MQITCLFKFTSKKRKFQGKIGIKKDNSKKEAEEFFPTPYPILT